MTNYLQSESYRFIRSKTYHVINMTLIVLMVVGAVLIKYLSAIPQADFASSLSLFYYGITLKLIHPIVFLNIIYASVLLKKDMKVMPISISSGTSRGSIFFGKLVVSLIGMITVEVILMALSIGIGLLLFGAENNGYYRDFIRSYIYLLPMIIAAFIMAYSLGIHDIRESYITMIIMLFFTISGKVVAVLSLIYEPIIKIHYLCPSIVIGDIVKKFDEGKVAFSALSLIEGVVISIICIAISYATFKKKDLR